MSVQCQTARGGDAVGSGERGFCFGWGGDEFRAVQQREVQMKMAALACEEGGGRVDLQEND